MSADLAWEAYAERVAALGFSVRREDDPPLIASQPVTRVRPDLWKGKLIEQLVQEAGRVVAGGGATGSERRTLRLKNSGLPYGTTQTLWAGVQYVNPGEHARPHRHTPNALRYVLRGQGSVTVVDGATYALGNGDFVLTPANSWHEHENRGSEPCYWLDCLDIPLVRALEVEFFENFPKPRQPEVMPAAPRAQHLVGHLWPAAPAPGAEPLLAYPAAEAYAALASLGAWAPDPEDGWLIEYVRPGGGHVLRTMACYLQALPGGFAGRAHRHTHSTLYYVAEGRGRTVVDGLELEWEAGDFFVVPSWSSHAHHTSSSAGRAVLFSVTDRPVFEALGLWRCQAE